MSLRLPIGREFAMAKIATLLSIGFGLGLAVAPAQAQLSRTFVSAASGSDANNCDRLTPCRTFQGAHDKTNDQGEIIVLDPGGYGGVTITKSISIVDDGVGEASVLVSGGATGIIIDSGAAGYVNLRGITIQGIGFGGGTGLRFNSGFALTLTNCVVRNHTGTGIELFPTVTTEIAISNTLVADNGGDGIALMPSGLGVANALFNRIEVYNNSHRGVAVDTAASTAPANTIFYTHVTESVVHNNLQAGFYIATSASLFNAVSPIVMIDRSVVANNAFGINNDPARSGAVHVSQTTVTGNTKTRQGFLVSYGDNYIAGNGDGGPGGDFIPPKK